MSTTQNPFFRKSMNGYNRDDVHAYIEKISSTFQEKEQEYQQQIASLAAQHAEDEQTIGALQKKLEDSTSGNDDILAVQSTMLNEAEAQLGVLQEKMDALQNSYTKEKEARQVLEHQCQALEQQYRALEQQYRTVQEKAALASETNALSNDDQALSLRAGKIIVSAHEAAEDVLHKAHAEADEIVQDATDYKERIFHRISATAETVMSDISAYMQAAMDKCFQDIYGTVNQNSEAENANVIQETAPVGDQSAPLEYDDQTSHD